MSNRNRTLSAWCTTEMLAAPGLAGGRPCWAVAASPLIPFRLAGTVHLQTAGKPGQD